MLTLSSEYLGVNNSTTRGAVAPITVTNATSRARAVSEIPSQPRQSRKELQWTHFLAPCFIASRQTRHGTVTSPGLATSGNSAVFPSVSDIQAPLESAVYQRELSGTVRPI